MSKIAYSAIHLAFNPRRRGSRKIFYRKVRDGQGTKWRRNIAENFNPLSRVHERYKTTDRQAMT